jgi:putative peptidoglycan lipid II flippase
MTATFLARGDTTTPVKALFVAVAVNVLLKILLMDRYAQVGLALATSVGAWINLALLIWFSARQNFLVIDQRLRRSTTRFAVAGVILGAALLLGERPIRALFAGWTSLRAEMTLLVLAAVGAIIYGIAIRILFHREWRALIQGR